MVNIWQCEENQWKLYQYQKHFKNLWIVSRTWAMLFWLHTMEEFFLYFRIILSCAICKVEVGMVNEFSNHVLAFVDSLLLLRSKVPNLSSYGQKLINSFYGTVASIKLSPHRLFFIHRFFSGIFKSDHYWFSLLLKQ